MKPTSPMAAATVALYGWRLFAVNPTAGEMVCGAETSALIAVTLPATLARYLAADCTPYVTSACCITL